MVVRREHVTSKHTILSKRKKGRKFAFNIEYNFYGQPNASVSDPDPAVFHISDDSKQLSKNVYNCIK